MYKRQPFPVVICDLEQDEKILCQSGAKMCIRDRFDRVDSLNQKSIQDMIDAYRASVSEESTSAESKSAQAQ